jgi:hypothetical protein
MYKALNQIPLSDFFGSDIKIKIDKYKYNLSDNKINNYKKNDLKKINNKNNNKNDLKEKISENFKNNYINNTNNINIIFILISFLIIISLKFNI